MTDILLKIIICDNFIYDSEISIKPDFKNVSIQSIEIFILITVYYP